MTYRVALIGAGGMGRTHLRHWSAMPEIEIVGALDTDREKAEAAQPGSAYTDWETLLSQAKPDIIDICTPTPEHHDYIQRAAAAGKAIFVEKPIGRTMADCNAAVEAVERTGVPLMAGHVVRYFPEYAAAKRLVDRGGVGTPAAIRAARVAGLPGAGRDYNWFGDPLQSGGVVLDLIIHDFDWLRWTFGPVSRVYAVGLYGKPQYVGHMDYALVTLRFQSGAVGHVTGSWAHAGFRTTFEIAGDTGLIEHDSLRSAPLTTMRRDLVPGKPGGVAVPESPMAAAEDPYYLELNAFLEALRAGTPPPVTAQDARESARIALAALESIETGRVIALN